MRQDVMEMRTERGQDTYRERERQREKEKYRFTYNSNPQFRSSQGFHEGEEYRPRVAQRLRADLQILYKHRRSDRTTQTLSFPRQRQSSQPVNPLYKNQLNSNIHNVWRGRSCSCCWQWLWHVQGRFRRWWRPQGCLPLRCWSPPPPGITLLNKLPTYIWETVPTKPTYLCMSNELHTYTYISKDFKVTLQLVWE